MAILLDSSGSISSKNWKIVKDFAKELVDIFKVKEKGSHAAIITYSTNPRVHLKFNSYRGAQLNAANIKRDIDRLRHQKGFTYIDKALELANRQVFTARAGMRRNVPKVNQMISILDK